MTQQVGGDGGHRQDDTDLEGAAEILGVEDEVGAPNGRALSWQEQPR